MIPTVVRRAALPLFVLSLSVLLVLASGCGDDDGDAGDRSPGPATSADGGDGGFAGSEAPDREFDLVMGDNTFEPDAFAATGGEAIAFNISNRGKAVHNVRIAGADNEYITGDDAVSLPTLIYADETATLEWAAPGVGGTFDFRCDFHPAMAGTIVVEPGDEPSDAGGEGP